MTRLTTKVNNSNSNNGNVGYSLLEWVLWTRPLTTREATQIHIKQPRITDARGHNLNWDVGRFQRLLVETVAIQEDFLEKGSLSSPTSLTSTPSCGNRQAFCLPGWSLSPGLLAADPRQSPSVGSSSLLHSIKVKIHSEAKSPIRLFGIPNWCN